MDRLTKRAEFLTVARGVRTGRRGFVLQAARQTSAHVVRFGFTVTKKVGNAPVRNRIRRRLKQAVLQVIDSSERFGIDYVLVAKLEALRLPFDCLVTDLRGALTQVSDRLKPQHQRQAEANNSFRRMSDP